MDAGRLSGISWQGVPVVMRDRDGELIYRIGRYVAEREPDPVEGLDEKPVWGFEYEWRRNR